MQRKEDVSIPAACPVFPLVAAVAVTHAALAASLAAQLSPKRSHINLVMMSMSVQFLPSAKSYQRLGLSEVLEPAVKVEETYSAQTHVETALYLLVEKNFLSGHQIRARRQCRRWGRSRGRDLLVRIGVLLFLLLLNFRRPVLQRRQVIGLR